MVAVDSAADSAGCEPLQKVVKRNAYIQVVELELDQDKKVAPKL